MSLAAAPASAQDVQRCEDASGKVSYANGQCPQGTTAVRTLPPAATPSAKATARMPRCRSSTASSAHAPTAQTSAWGAKTTRPVQRPAPYAITILRMGGTAPP